MNILLSNKGRLALWIVAFLSIGAVIGHLTAGDVASWYRTLNRPSFTPPNLVFPLVWVCLYVCLATVGWRLSNHLDVSPGKLCFSLFGVQMVMNWGWSFLFFKFHLTGAAFAWILIMIALTATLILKSWDLDRIAAILLGPYLLWIGFASALCGMIWVLN